MSAIKKMVKYLEISDTFQMISEECLLLYAITAEAKRLLAEEQEQQKDPTYLIAGLRMWAEHSPVFTSKKERDEYKKFLSRYTPAPEKREEPLAELAGRKGCFLKIETSYTLYGRKDGIDVEFSEEKTRAFLNALPDAEV